MQPSFERFAAHIQAVQKEILRIQSREMEAFDLKPNAYFILHHLADHSQAMTSADLARTMDVSRAVVSRSLHNLLERKLIRLSTPHMEYGTRIILTEQGQAILLELNARARTYAQDAIQGISEDSRAQMYEVLAHIISNLKGI